MCTKGDLLLTLLYSLQISSVSLDHTNKNKNDDDDYYPQQCVCRDDLQVSWSHRRDKHFTFCSDSYLHQNVQQTHPVLLLQLRISYVPIY